MRACLCKHASRAGGGGGVGRAPPPPRKGRRHAGVWGASGWRAPTGRLATVRPRELGMRGTVWQGMGGLCEGRGGRVFRRESPNVRRRPAASPSARVSTSGPRPHLSHPLLHPSTSSTPLHNSRSRGLHPPRRRPRGARRRQKAAVWIPTQRCRPGPRSPPPQTVDSPQHCALCGGGRD